MIISYEYLSFFDIYFFDIVFFDISFFDIYYYFPKWRDNKYYKENFKHIELTDVYRTLMFKTYDTIHMLKLEYSNVLNLLDKYEQAVIKYDNKIKKYNK